MPGRPVVGLLVALHLDGHAHPSFSAQGPGVSREFCNSWLSCEEVSGVSDSYLALVAAQRLSWALKDRATFKQEIVANISAEDTDNFTFVASAHTFGLFWMIGLEYLFDNQPAIGRGKKA